MVFLLTMICHHIWRYLFIRRQWKR